MFTLSNLEKAGLLKKQVCPTSFLFYGCDFSGWLNYVDGYLKILNTVWHDVMRLLNLEVLFLQEGKSNWQAIKKGLKLVPEENREENDDIK